MSFHISDDGEIESVFYKEEENVLILALKKVILSALSSKLVISQQSLSNQTRWAYAANETGHEGMKGHTGHGNSHKNKTLL